MLSQAMEIRSGLDHSQLFKNNDKLYILWPRYTLIKKKRKKRKGKKKPERVKCQDCNKKFRKKAFRDQHWNSVHWEKTENDTNLKKEGKQNVLQIRKKKCRKCKKLIRFSWISTLKKHYREHNWLFCEICLRGYSNQDNYDNHIIFSKKKHPNT